jgi:hypothetical protein
LPIDDCRLPIEDTKGTRGGTNSRAVLRVVKNPRDSGGVLFKLIHRDTGQRWEGRFAPPAHVAAGSPEVGKIP